MRIIVFLLIIAVLPATVVHGRQGSLSSSSRYRSASSCTTDLCKYICIGIGCAAAVFIIVFFTILCYSYGGNLRKGKPLLSNSKFVKLALSKTLGSEVHEFIFQTGFWNSRLKRSGIWHGPFRFFLTFNPKSMSITGSGTDDVGTFDINGFYSHRTHRIAFTKMYRSDNESNNPGRQLKMQLAWNTKEKSFKGKWYEETNLNKGKGAFELTLENEQNQLAFVNV